MGMHTHTCISHSGIPHTHIRIAYTYTKHTYAHCIYMCKNIHTCTHIHAYSTQARYAYVHIAYTYTTHIYAHCIHIHETYTHNENG